jgi:hypothetical protein
MALELLLYFHLNYLVVDLLVEYFLLLPLNFGLIFLLHLNPHLLLLDYRRYPHHLLLLMLLVMVNLQKLNLNLKYL